MILSKTEFYEGGKLLSLFFVQVANLVTVGTTGLEIDNYIGELFKKYQCISAPIKEYNFPGYSCISINDCMCHGIPNNYKFQHGDVVSIDISFFYKDLFFDAGRTFIVIDPNAKISFKIKTLMELNGFNVAIHLQAIHLASQIYLSNNARGIKTDYSIIGQCFHRLLSDKYSVSYEYGGHKIGKKLHLPPFVSSVNAEATGYYLTAGDTFCFEPLLALRSGTSDKIIARKEKNGWEIYNAAGEYTVHYENTYLVLPEGIFPISL